MTTRSGSFVFVTGIALKHALDQVSWPVLQESPNPPTVQFGDPFGEASAPREIVGLVGVVDDPGALQEWATTGNPSRDESFTFTIVVRTMIPGRTGDEAWLRLGDLCDSVQSVVRSLTTGRPIIPASIDMLTGVGVWNVSVQAVRPSIVPGTEGYQGHAIVQLACRARI